MITSFVKTDTFCLGCGGNLYTTRAEIFKRIARIEARQPGEDRKHPPNTIRVWCISRVCPAVPRPHQEWTAIYTSILAVPNVRLPE